MRGQGSDHVTGVGQLEALQMHGEWTDKHTDTRREGHRNSITDPTPRAKSVKIRV